jgi:hypothetical protein
MHWWRSGLALSLLVVAVASRAAVEDDGLSEAAKVFGSRESRAQWRAAALEAQETLPLSLMPLVGGTRYVGPAVDAVTSEWTMGLILELPVNVGFSVEIEGGYENAFVAYRSQRDDGTLTDEFSHRFQRMQLGLGLKSYVARGVLNPYIGAGFHGVRYGGLLRGPLSPEGAYEQWVGAVQAVAGLEIALSESISFGARAAFTQAVASLPVVELRRGRIVPGSEELALTRNGFLRFLGAVKVAL